jgi:xanthine dehydrogenase accessory factor
MSSDWHQLLGFLREHQASPMALATLVAREGSSYRQPGARLLVSAGGACAGSLSGGCLEEGIAEIAQKVLVDGKIRIEHIDTRPHFGCPGKLTILIERLEPGLVTELLHRVRARASFSLTTSKTGSKIGAGEGFIEQIGPRPRLVVIGWTSDQEPLFKMAELLGWECHRVLRDVRMEMTRVAHEELSVCPADQLMSSFVPDEVTAVLVMSHHMATDLAFLKAAVTGRYAYVGLLGSRRRREELLAELGACGLLEDDHWVSRFHAPIGLDLGAENPATISLSILAEIQAVFAGRSGGFLRDRVGAIHLLSTCG